MKKCYFCGSKKILEKHHLDKNYKNNDLSNLLLVCKSCHHKLHSKIYTPLEKGIVDRRRKLVKIINKIYTILDDIKEYD